MRVVELEARHVRIALKRTVTHASHVRTDTDNIVVRCVLSDGAVGYGEGVPRDYVTGETIDFALDLLKRAELGKQLDDDCPDFVAAVHFAERLKMPADPGDDRLIRGNAARCAVEIAVLDAFGRALGEPLTKVTELVAPDLYKFRPEVRYSGVITNPRRLKRRLVPLIYRIAGFEQVKLKVGITGQDDVKRTRLVRGWLVRRSICAWTPTGLVAGWVVERIRELTARHPSVEQPVRHEMSPAWRRCESR